MILDVVLSPESSLRSLVLDDTIQDDTLTRISNWIRDSQTLNKLGIGLCTTNLNESVKRFFFESLAVSKSLVDICISVHYLGEIGYKAVCDFISRTNAIVVKLGPIVWQQSFDLTPLPFARS